MVLATTLFEFLGYFITALAVRHSLEDKGKKDTLCFFLPLFFLVFLIEEIAVVVFNGYSYPDYNIYFFRVPLAILLGWCAIVYGTYHMSKSFFNGQRVLRISFLAAIIGVVIDLLLEPVAYSWNLWVWSRPDIYFNASIENFISWFSIIFAFTAVFDYMRNTIGSLHRRLLVMHLSSIAIVAALILIITVWKVTVNL